MLPRNPLHQDRATGRQVCETTLDLLRDRDSGVGQERRESQVDAEVAVCLAHEVEHGETLLLLMEPKATAELLEKYRQALGRSEEQHHIDLRDIDALVIQVHDEQNVHITTAEAVLGREAV